MFKKYMHLERFGTDAVDGINDGITQVFPKLDGTNASLWLEDTLMGGSRNRVLSVENDNAGFYKWALLQDSIKNFFIDVPTARLYGEWLVPHSLNTYRQDAWRKFYIFEVEIGDEVLTYDQYLPIITNYNLDFVPLLATVKNGQYEDYVKLLEKNTFLIEDGKGVGEGIVIKNHAFINKFGQQVWAKIVTNEFKAIHSVAMGAPIIGPDLVEEKIVIEFVTEAFVRKTYAKIVNEEKGWHSKFIPQLLGRVWYDLITEESWNIVKKYNGPKIDFKLLQRMTIAQIKVVMKDIF